MFYRGFRSKKILLTVIFIMVFLTPTLLFAEVMKTTRVNTELPLLLNSGLADCNEAAVKYIVWTEDPGKTDEIENILPSTGLIWQKQILSDFAGKKVFQYMTAQKINEEEERQAFILYHSLYTVSMDGKAQVFFEERVGEAIHAENYFEYNHISRKQNIIINDMMSIGGFDQRLPGGVKAGEDKINIQMVTKGENKTGNGKTVLALPALMEEF
ncbi:MAG: hypothetical protein GX434_02220 [Peptococcaceae bacterium]|nr:hypothetical protein [Peptococcaceae bacterium]